MNPEFMARLPLPCRVFVFGHELFHVFLNHPHRFTLCAKRNRVLVSPFVNKLAQIAADLVVNDFCKEGRFGRIWSEAIHDPKLGTMHDTWEEVYERLYKDAKDAGEIAKDGSYAGGKWGGPCAQGMPKLDPNGDPTDGAGSDGGDVLQPGGSGSITQDDIDERDARLKSDMQAARNDAKARGKMPGGLDAMIEGWLEPQIAWHDELRAELATNYGKEDADYMRSNRKAIVLPGIVLPGRKGYRLGRGVLAMDTSGSVSDAELREFFGEASPILQDLRPELVYLVMCDARITSVDEIDPAQEDPEESLRDRAKHVGGRGGTSFSPVFDRIRNGEFEDVEWLVYLTDMHAQFPEPVPGVQMIWVATTDIVAPYGRTIRIKVRENAV